MAAHSVRVMEINNMADQFVRSGHTQSRAIRRRQQQLNDRWAHYKMQTHESNDFSGLGKESACHALQFHVLVCNLSGKLQPWTNFVVRSDLLQRSFQRALSGDKDHTIYVWTHVSIVSSVFHNSDFLALKLAVRCKRKLYPQIVLYNIAAMFFCAILLQEYVRATALFFVCFLFAFFAVGKVFSVWKCLVSKSLK